MSKTIPPVYLQSCASRIDELVYIIMSDPCVPKNKFEEMIRQMCEKYGEFIKTIESLDEIWPSSTQEKPSHVCRVRFKHAPIPFYIRALYREYSGQSIPLSILL